MKTGVIIISIIWLLFGAFGIVNTFVANDSIYFVNINGLKYVLFAGNLLISLAALSGIIFWLSGKPNLIIIYSYFAYAIVAILLIIDLINMIAYKTNKNGNLQFCHDKLKSNPEFASKTDSDLNNICNGLFRKFFIIFIIITGLHFVISSYFAIIVAAYANTFKGHHDDSSGYYLTRDPRDPRNYRQPYKI